MIAVGLCSVASPQKFLFLRQVLSHLKEVFKESQVKSAWIKPLL